MRREGKSVDNIRKIEPTTDIETFRACRFAVTLAYTNVYVPAARTCASGGGGGRTDADID